MQSGEKGKARDIWLSLGNSWRTHPIRTTSVTNCKPIISFHVAYGTVISHLVHHKLDHDTYLRLSTSKRTSAAKFPPTQPDYIPRPFSLTPRHDPPRPDEVVRISSEQGLAVGAPRQTNALGLAALLAHGRIVWLELVDLALLLEVEDDDARRRGGAQPVAVGRKDERVDLVARAERVQVLALVQVPQHRRAVLAARRTQRAVGRDGHRVDIA